MFGKNIELSQKYKEIQNGFDELRKCMSSSAYNAAVMMAENF